MIRCLLASALVSGTNSQVKLAIGYTPLPGALVIETRADLGIVAAAAAFVYLNQIGFVYALDRSSASPKAILFCSA